MSNPEKKTPPSNNSSEMLSDHDKSTVLDGLQSKEVSTYPDKIVEVETTGVNTLPQSILPVRKADVTSSHSLPQQNGHSVPKQNGTASATENSSKTPSNGKAESHNHSPSELKDKTAKPRPTIDANQEVAQPRKLIMTPTEPETDVAQKLTFKKREDKPKTTVSQPVSTSRVMNTLLVSSAINSNHNSEEPESQSANHQLMSKIPPKNPSVDPVVHEGQLGDKPIINAQREDTPSPFSTAMLIAELKAEAGNTGDSNDGEAVGKGPDIAHSDLEKDKDEKPVEGEVDSKPTQEDYENMKAIGQQLKYFKTQDEKISEIPELIGLPAQVRQSLRRINSSYVTNAVQGQGLTPITNKDLTPIPEPVKEPVKVPVESTPTVQSTPPPSEPISSKPQIPEIVTSKTPHPQLPPDNNPFSAIPGFPVAQGQPPREQPKTEKDKESKDKEAPPPKLYCRFLIVVSN